MFREKKYQRIVFVIDSVSQPRCLRRIRGFISAGYKVKVFGFDRSKYANNAFLPGIEIEILGQQKDGKDYIKKFFQSKRAIKKVINNHRSDETIFYAFGFNQAFFMIINGASKYIYEISDILYGYRKFYLFRWFFKVMDRCLIRKSLLTVVTSKGFVNYLYSNRNPSKVIVQSNKVDYSLNYSKRPEFSLPNSQNSLVFAYVGAFRYPNTIFRFARIIGENYPKHQFHFIGESILTSEVIKIANKYPNVKHLGAFNNPEDLPDIYNKIDFLVACYDTTNLNERIAEPNKLYESLYFKKPIIVSKNTFLEKRVNQFKCGFAIDASKDKDLIDFVKSITLEQIEFIHKKIESICIEEFIDDNSAKIISRIESEERGL